MTDEKYKRDAEQRTAEAWKDNQIYLMKSINELSMELATLKDTVHSYHTKFWIASGIGSVTAIVVYRLLEWMFV
jgi:hypothetical protein